MSTTRIGKVIVQVSVSNLFDPAKTISFDEMEPTAHGYEPLVGYTVLALAGIVVDMVTHRMRERISSSPSPSLSRRTLLGMTSHASAAIGTCGS